MVIILCVDITVVGKRVVEFYKSNKISAVSPLLKAIHL